MGGGTQQGQEQANRVVQRATWDTLCTLCPLCPPWFGVNKSARLGIRALGLGLSHSAAQPQPPNLGLS